MSVDDIEYEIKDGIITFIAKLPDGRIYKHQLVRDDAYRALGLKYGSGINHIKLLKEKVIKHIKDGNF